MSEIDYGRLRVFFGTLIPLVIVFQLVSWVTGLKVAEIGLAYMFTPMLAALAVMYRHDFTLAEFGVRSGRVRWIGAAVVAGLVVVGLTVVISLAIPSVTFDPVPLESTVGLSGNAALLTAFGLTAVFGVTVGAIMAFGEEFGWRGYLLWELAPLGFWKASLAIGFLWGSWHLPSVIEGSHYHSFPLLGIPVIIGVCVALSPIYTYLVWRAESVFAAVLLHGVFNSASMTVIPFIKAGSDLFGQLVVTTMGIAGIAAYGLVVLIIALNGTPTLARTHLSSSTAHDV